MSIVGQVTPWIGKLRERSFLRAVKWAESVRPTVIIETGCYRGIDPDGQSTRVLATLAAAIGAAFHSFDINPDHIAKAKALLETDGLKAEFHVGDSVTNLKEFDRRIGLAYLDSFDYECANPSPSQLHHKAEAEVVLPKMEQKSLIIVDDCNIEGGGKVALAEPLIIAAGYTRVCDDYQKIFIR